MMKHNQILANLVELKVGDFEEIDSLTSSLEDKTMRELVMELETKDGNNVFIAAKRS